MDSAEAGWLSQRHAHAGTASRHQHGCVDGFTVINDVAGGGFHVAADGEVSGGV
jgi:hypothetical protein